MPSAVLFAVNTGSEKSAILLTGWGGGARIPPQVKDIPSWAQTSLPNATGQAARTMLLQQRLVTTKSSASSVPRPKMSEQKAESTLLGIRLIIMP